MHVFTVHVHVPVHDANILQLPPPCCFTACKQRTKTNDAFIMNDEHTYAFMLLHFSPLESVFRPPKVKSMERFMQFFVGCSDTDY